jgi:hypothetical protein
VDTDSLYWALSTLPQVAAALVAFIGFVVQQRIAEVEARAAPLEKYIRESVSRLPFPETLTKNDPTGIGVRSVERGKLIRELRRFFAEDARHAQRWGSAISSLDLLEPLHEWTAESRIAVIRFTIWNLFIIAASLALLPFSSRLAGADIAVYTWLSLCVSVVVTSGFMIRRGLNSPP